MQFDVNRRSFVKGMGGAAAGFSVLGTSGCASVFGRNKIRLAVFGVWGKGFSDWLPMLKTGRVEIVAFCDADKNTLVKAEAKLKQYKREGTLTPACDGFDVFKVPFYDDYRNLLADAPRLGVDAITVSFSDHMHAPVAIQAMKLGIHCYVQKPLVRTLAELAAFNKVAKECNVITQMGNQGSALSSMRRCTEVLQSGIIGDTREVHVWTNRPVWPQGAAAMAGVTSARDKKRDKIPAGFNWDTWLGPAKERPFKGAYAEGKKGYDPWNLCDNVYHPFSWRGFFDFGCGAFGDMACHTMNLAFRGLELGRCKSAECLMIEDKTDVAYPMKSVVKMTYAARKSQVRPGVELPECVVYWYDGNQKPDASKLPAVACPGGKVSDTGCILVGTEGTVSMTDDYGGKCLIALKGEKEMTDLFLHEKAKAVSRVIPFREDAANKIEKGAGAAAVSADGHYVEFLDAIEGVGPVFADTHSRCYSDVDYSIPLMEGILVGCAAQQVPGVLNWDSCKQTFDNADANRLIRPYVRKGFEYL